jgi:ribosome-binding factor A
MKKQAKPQNLQGPTQRQLRAGELVRHTLVEILREETLSDPALQGVSITVTEARVSPDLRHAQVFVEPLGGANAVEVVKGLNRITKFLRGRLGHMIDMKFTPDLKFHHDDTFNSAAAIDRLFDDPRVQADLAKPASEDED